jgi:predicted adenine nucleotide alpha hydrolase (AANH) superfamily ATPase
MTISRKILVHACCAPCAAPSIERLLLDDMEVGLYFSNSNIYPEAEYRKRLEYVRKLAGICEVVLEEDTYDHERWLEHIRGLENEPEKGLRCIKCFEYSLSRTAELADRLNYDAFTTTLTLSPHKISKIIFEIGTKFPKYLPYDFKKKNGFIRSVELSSQWDLYRQAYCGCEFSIRTS